MNGTPRMVDNTRMADQHDAVSTYTHAEPAAAAAAEEPASPPSEPRAPAAYTAREVRYHLAQLNVLLSLLQCDGVLLLVAQPEEAAMASFTPAADALTQSPLRLLRAQIPQCHPSRLRPHNQNLATTGLRTTPVKKGLLESTATTATATAATESPVTELKQLALGACSLRMRFSHLMVRLTRVVCVCSCRAGEGEFGCVNLAASAQPLCATRSLCRFNARYHACGRQNAWCIGITRRPPSLGRGFRPCFARGRARHSHSARRRLPAALHRASAPSSCATSPDHKPAPLRRPRKARLVGRRAPWATPPHPAPPPLARSELARTRGPRGDPSPPPTSLNAMPSTLTPLIMSSWQPATDSPLRQWLPGCAL